MPYKDYEKQKENARQYYYANKERKLAQAKEYYYANWDAKQKYRKEWLKAHPEVAKSSKSKYAKKRNSDPATKQKTRAYNKVKWALKVGTLTKPESCELCNATGRIDAHHPYGYSDECALKIKWLCKICHEGEHHAVSTKAMVAT